MIKRKRARFSLRSDIHSMLFYRVETAETIIQHTGIADTINVEDIIYDNLREFLLDTLRDS